MSRFVRFFVHASLAAFILLAVGTICHEAGHALVATMNGAVIAEVNVLGVRVYPPIALEPRAGYWGYVTWMGELSPKADLWTSAAGSAATWIVSLFALILRLRRSPPRFGTYRATVHLAFLAYSLDAALHTLPVVGFPVTVFFGAREPGPRVSELYYAATALGVSHSTLMAFIFGDPLLSLGVVLGGAARSGGRGTSAVAPAGGASPRGGRVEKRR